MVLVPSLLLATFGFFVPPPEKLSDSVPKSSPEQRLGFARQSAGAYRFRIGARGAGDVTLHPEPLLRWNNQVVREDDGMLFLWTRGDKGRPVATAQFFVVDTVWHHEFQSLSLDRFEARFETARGGDNWTWQPDGPGIKFALADNVDSPAGSAGLRLRQMKNIAEQFNAAVDPAGKFESPEQLRLLTTPVYRYSASDDKIVDGALFAFVQGTNPEVLLLVEAQGAESGTAVWRYGFARMSCFSLRVRRGEALVWERDRAPVPTPSRTSPYYFRLSALPDRSAEMEAAPAQIKK